MDLPLIISSASAGDTIYSGESSDYDIPPAPKKPRGRPKGSKNRAKAPPVVTSDRSHNLAVIEIPSGANVTDSLLRFSRQRRLAMTVLTASGSVAMADLRCRSNSPENNFTAIGSFLVLSLSGTVTESSSSLVTLLRRMGGEVFGGAIVGSLLATSAVKVVAATTEFNDSTDQRLAGDGEDNNSDDLNRCYINNGSSFGYNLTAALALADESPLGEVLRECDAIQRSQSNA